MYYPFLRARQFELIALRELANEGMTQGFILPILEPVKKSINNLNLAYNVFQEQQQLVYLILNPSVGELKGDNTYYIDYLSELDEAILRPAFHYRNNANYIRQSIADYALKNCMLICQNDVSVDDNDFRSLVKLNEISSINVEDTGRNRTLDRFLRGLNKTYIRLDDFFEKQSRNSDFRDIEEHRFSEEHLYFEDEGYRGFSDYTVLPSEFSDGGSTPRAVVIHLTFINGQNQIWIRHFTSDTNDSISNVQGKFAEAAEKTVRYCRLNHLTNSAIQELETFFNEEHYPGLGTVKKISIKNHLLIVRQFLGNK
ncbi:MAG: sce7725 family protein [Bacteroidales bacterium]|nr:sce7725 family protein [Bacteroidales bacterium]